MVGWRAAVHTDAGTVARGKTRRKVLEARVGEKSARLKLRHAAPKVRHQAAKARHVAAKTGHIGRSSGTQQGNKATQLEGRARGGEGAARRGRAPPRRPEGAQGWAEASLRTWEAAERALKVRNFGAKPSGVRANTVEAAARPPDASAGGVLLRIDGLRCPCMSWKLPMRAAKLRGKVREFAAGSRGSRFSD